MTIKDIKKIIDYWTKAAVADLEVAGSLLKSKRYSYSLFFCHLAIKIDPLIEPVAFSPEQYRRDTTSPLLDEIKKTGIRIV